VYNGPIPRTGEILEGIIREARLYAELDPEWFILFEALGGTYHGLLMWSDPIVVSAWDDEGDRIPECPAYAVTFMHALTGAGKEVLWSEFRREEEKHIGDDVTKFTTLGPGAKLAGTPVSVEVKVKETGKPGIKKFLRISEETLTERHASRVTDLDAEIYGGTRSAAAARQVGKRETVRADKAAGVVEFVRSNPGKTKTQIATALGGNRNSRFTMIKNLLGGGQLVERDGKLYTQ
jgi:hypothetical protein